MWHHDLRRGQAGRACTPSDPRRVAHLPPEFQYAVGYLDTSTGRDRRSNASRSARSPDVRRLVIDGARMSAEALRILVLADANSIHTEKWVRGLADSGSVELRLVTMNPAGVRAGPARDPRCPADRRVLRGASEGERRQLAVPAEPAASHSRGSSDEAGRDRRHLPLELRAHGRDRQRGCRPGACHDRLGCHGRARALLAVRPHHASDTGSRRPVRQCFQGDDRARVRPCDHPARGDPDPTIRTGGLGHRIPVTAEVV